jgi:hypothetical protein
MEAVFEFPPAEFPPAELPPATNPIGLLGLLGVRVPLRVPKLFTTVNDGGGT